MISAYSVCSAVIICNLFQALVFLLRRRTRFLARHTVSLLVFISALGLVRLFTPVDFKSAVVIQSWHLLPAIQSASHAEIPFLGISVCAALLILWGCGSLVFAAKDAAAALRALRRRRGYTYVEDERVSALAKQLYREGRVKVSPQVAEPYVAGVFRPVIYLPCMELTEEELFFILRHEAEHIRARDGLKKLLFLVVKWLFWFNPFVYVSMGEIDSVLELRCDEKVVKELGGADRARYMDTLISVLKQLSPVHETSDLCTVCFAGNGDTVKQRFELMLSPERRRPKSSAALYAAALLVFALSYFVIVQPASMPPEIEGQFYFTPENSFIVREGDTYVVYFEGERCGPLEDGDLSIPPFTELEIKDIPIS